MSCTRTAMAGRRGVRLAARPPPPRYPECDESAKASVAAYGGSHVRCNQEDCVWRGRIRRMLEQGMSLDEVAQKLNDKAIHAPHGGGGWSAATVRKAFVS